MATGKSQRREAEVTARGMQNCAAEGTSEWSRKDHGPVFSVPVLEKHSLGERKLDETLANEELRVTAPPSNPEINPLSRDTEMAIVYIIING